MKKILETVLFLLFMVVMIYGCENSIIKQNTDNISDLSIKKYDNNNVCINMLYYEKGTLKLFKDNAHAIHIVKQGRDRFFIVEKPEFDTLLKININQIEVLLTEGKGVSNCE